MNFSDNIDWYEALGVEAPEGTSDGVEEQEPTEPAEDTQGAEEQEVTDPADDQEPEADEPESGEDEEKNEETDTPKGGKTEEDSKYAAARRKAERERNEAIAKAQAEADRKIETFLKNSGATNPYTRQPIKTAQEFDAYQQQYEVEQKKEFMRNNNMDDDSYREFVDNLPEVKAAKQAALEARKAAADVRIAEQIQEIGKLDPSIRSLQDLSKMENYETFYKLVNERGMTLTEAFKLANYDKLTRNAAEGARQAARNAAQGKQHLTSTKQRGEGSVYVSEEEKAWYRALEPGITDEEIQKDYAKRHKNERR